MQEYSTIRIIVEGKVQGVFFRKYAAAAATEIGATGYVRNCKDGSVEIVATGTAAQLDALYTWCKSGSPRAIVQRITQTALPLQSFSRFEIVRN